MLIYLNIDIPVVNILNKDTFTKVMNEAVLPINRERQQKNKREKRGIVLSD